MEWVVKRLFKQRADSDLMLVAQGIDRAFLLYFSAVLFVGVAMLVDSLLNGRLGGWVLLLFAVLGLLGFAFIGYRIGFKATQAGWLLGIVPIVVVMLTMALYGAYSSGGFLPEGIWGFFGVPIVASLGGSIAGDLRRKKLGTMSNPVND